jgi:uncharacterized membrane protein
MSTVKMSNLQTEDRMYALVFIVLVSIVTVYARESVSHLANDVLFIILDGIATVQTVHCC